MKNAIQKNMQATCTHIISVQSANQSHACPIARQQRDFRRGTRPKRARFFGKSSPLSLAHHAK